MSAEDPRGRESRRLTILLRSTDKVHHHALAREILARARRGHLAGATMLEGIEGHGRSGVSHRRHMFTEDVPRSILIVDYEERIAGFIEANHDVLDRAVVLVETVTAFQA